LFLDKKCRELFNAKALKTKSPFSEFLRIQKGEINQIKKRKQAVSKQEVLL